MGGKVLSHYVPVWAEGTAIQNRLDGVYEPLVKRRIVGRLFLAALLVAPPFRYVSRSFLQLHRVTHMVSTRRQRPRWLLASQRAGYVFYSVSKRFNTPCVSNVKLIITLT